MAENKTSFVLYSDNKTIIDLMSNEHAGLLLKTLFSYVNDENPTIENTIAIPFEMIKLQLKRDLKKWEKTKEGRSVAGKASAEARKLAKINEQNLTNSTNVDFVQQTSTNSTVTDSVSVSDINKDISKVFLSEIEISDDENFLIYNDEKFERTKSEIKYFEIANVFRKTFIENLKEKGAPFKAQENATFKNYVDPIRLMLENKECTVDDLRDVESYLSGKHSEFWKKNILSTVKLRKQIQQLIMEARKPIVKPKPQERL